MLVLVEHWPASTPDQRSPSKALRPERSTPGAGLWFLVSFINALGIEQAHPVGGSQGGLIAGHFAIGNPSLVRSLTLAGTAGVGREKVDATSADSARRGRILLQDHRAESPLHAQVADHEQ